MLSRTDQTLPKDWQLSCKELKQRSAKLLESGLMSDCWFVVGDAGRPVAAHSLILAMASPVFQGMFSDVTAVAAESKPILVPDIQPDTFQALLEYMYTDRMNVKSCSAAYELYFAARKYKLPDLQTRCVLYLQLQMSPQNACSSYEFAESAQEEELKTKCLEMIKSRTREVLAAKSFEELHVDTVEKIFSLHPLTIDSELELFKAAERYAKAHGSVQTNSANCPTIKVEPNDSGNTMEVDKNLQEKDDMAQGLRKAIKHIRFLALNSEEFSQHDFSYLLTVLEINAIALNLISDKAHKPMPSGFSTSRVPRNKSNNFILPKLKTVKPNTTQDKHFHTEIFDIRYLLECSIHMFEMHNLTWILDVNPRTEHRRIKKKPASLGLFITCFPDQKCNSWSCQVKLIVWILSYNVKAKPYRVERVTQFTNKHQTRGWNSVISLKELMAPEHGYVLHDAIRVHVHVSAEQPVLG